MYTYFSKTLHSPHPSLNDHRIKHFSKDKIRSKLFRRKQKNKKRCVLTKIHFLKYCRRRTALKTTEMPATAVHRIFPELFRQNPEAIYPNYTKKKSLDK